MNRKRHKGRGVRVLAAAAFIAAAAEAAWRLHRMHKMGRMADVPYDEGRRPY